MAWSYIEKIIIETDKGLVIPYDASIQEGNLKRLRRIQEAEHDHIISYIKRMEIYTKKFKITFSTFSPHRSKYLRLITLDLMAYMNDIKTEGFTLTRVDLFNDRDDADLFSRYYSKKKRPLRPLVPALNYIKYQLTNDQTKSYGACVTIDTPHGFNTNFGYLHLWEFLLVPSANKKNWSLEKDGNYLEIGLELI